MGKVLLHVIVYRLHIPEYTLEPLDKYIVFNIRVKSIVLVLCKSNQPTNGKKEMGFVKIKHAYQNSYQH